MIEDTLVINGRRANYNNKVFPARKIRLIKSFSNSWEKEFYRANLHDMPGGILIESPMPENTTIILKSEDNPYWLEIYTTEKSWVHKLVAHDLAVLRLAHTWPSGEKERHYILPAILLHFSATE